MTNIPKTHFHDILSISVQKLFPLSHAKVRDEQQETLTAATQHMEELERQVQSGNEKLEMEKQKLLSLQKVCKIVYIMYCLNKTFFLNCILKRKWMKSFWLKASTYKS